MWLEICSCEVTRAVPPLVGAAIASGLAALFGGVMANRSNAKQAQKQMDFQERMSSTSYQRATEDMRMSGINPMLAFQQGGASSPGGAQAQMQDVIGPAVSSAMHTKRLGEEIKSMEADRELKSAESANYWAQNTRNMQERAESVAREQLIRTQIPNEKQHGRLLMYQADMEGAEALKARLDANRSASAVGRGLDWVKKFRESIIGSGNLLMTLPGRGSAARTQVGGFR